MVSSLRHSPLDPGLTTAIEQMELIWLKRQLDPIARLDRNRAVDADGHQLLAKADFKQRLRAQRLDKIDRELREYGSTVEAQMSSSESARNICASTVLPYSR